jgi:cytosine/adenosine deaminase-related metal-dependent hydrolase
MSIQKITAELIHTTIGDPLEDHVVITDEDGTVLSIDSITDHDPASVRKLNGWLIPGFVNSHCHLELSHMKGLVDTGLGLTAFIEDVVKMRGAQEEVIREAISAAENEMINSGIVAVGDISNATDSFLQKQQNNLRYHTFIEYFDLLQPDWLKKEYEKYENIFQALELPEGHAKSRVPHATYSVSEALMDLLRRSNKGHRVSINMQEFPGEDIFIRSKQGALLNFYDSFELSTDAFQAKQKSSLLYAIDQLDRSTPTIFVHNTMMTSADLYAALDNMSDPYFCFCPNANLYIENRLPDYGMFFNAEVTCCLGTDSLTSNWQLSILEEMRTIKKYASYVPTHELIRWATINGARALGFEDELGSIELGKRPGLLCLKNPHEMRLWEVERII